MTSDPERLINSVRELRPDVVTIEVEPLGDRTGEVLRRLMAAWPTAQIVVLTSDQNVAHAVEAARIGVAAWVSKEQGADELQTVLHGVRNGSCWLPPPMLGTILRELRAALTR